MRALSQPLLTVVCLQSVAAVHDMVTDQTWKCIMEYEDLHKE